jgi:hypothetical protein
VAFGGLRPEIAGVIDANVDPGDRLSVIVTGLGMAAIALTPKKVIVVTAQLDLAASDSGAAGALGGAAVGGLVGDAIGTYLADSGSLRSMVVGGLVGTALGAIVGGAAGQAATAREVVNIIPVCFPYGSIASVAAGLRTVTTAQGQTAIPSLVFSTSAWRTPVEFFYHPAHSDVGAAVLRAIKTHMARPDAALNANANPGGGKS